MMMEENEKEGFRRGSAVQGAHVVLDCLGEAHAAKRLTRISAPPKTSKRILPSGERGSFPKAK